MAAVTLFEQSALTLISQVNVSLSVSHTYSRTGPSKGVKLMMELSAMHLIALHDQKAGAERVCPCCRSSLWKDELQVVTYCTVYDSLMSLTTFAGLHDKNHDMRAHLWHRIAWYCSDLVHHHL